MSDAARDRLALGRGKVLLGALVGLGLLAGIVAGVDALRHPPLVTRAPEAEPDAGDPRLDIECPDLPADPGPLPVTSDDLYECPAVYDGALVAYEGEVVGAVMRRADGAWAQLNDDAYAGDLGPLPAHREFRGGNAGVGVHLPAAVADLVDWVGGPAARGDVLRVVGTFHRVDATSGEVAVIRATEGETLRRGQRIDHSPLADRQAAGVVIALAALGFLGTEQTLRRRRGR